jgi:hypothetical protein
MNSGDPAPAQSILQSATPLNGDLRNSTEPIIGIVPFVEQGLLSVIHYTIIITPQRIIFCTWDPDTDETMSEAEDEVMQESCTIAETTDEIAHFRSKDWSTGPWQRYRSMPVETITAAAPGSITIPITGSVIVDIVCENSSSTQDMLYINDGNRQYEFDLMHSQGPFLYRLLQPVLNERVRISDHLHRRGKLDRLLTGQEYRT